MDMRNQQGVRYIKGVVYVAEESAVTCVDVGGVVRLKPSRMRKPLVAHAAKQKRALGD